MQSKKVIGVGLILSFVLLCFFIVQFLVVNDSKLHIVFCDVGQGDGIYIRTPNGTDIIIDAGPDASIVECLSRHIPFWDRTIEVVILTHPHDDHLAGFIEVFDRYEVKHFITENVSNDTASFKTLLDVIQEEGIVMRYLYKNDTFATSDGVRFKILGPSKVFLQKTSPNGEIDEGHGFGNLILHLSYGEFDTIFTGDSQVEGLAEALGGLGNRSIEVFQVPHHGSKTGLNKDIIGYRVRPSLAVISVGAKNKYGHPTEEILKILKDYHVKTLRTDEKGDIEIISDGKTFSVQ